MVDANKLVAYADGAIGDGRSHTGVGAVLMDGRGRIHQHRPDPRM